MDSAPKPRSERPSADILDFDAALLAACSAHERADLLAEAEMLAAALPPERRAEELATMARALSRGGRPGQLDRRRARRLAAALRQVAKVG